MNTYLENRTAAQTRHETVHSVETRVENGHYVKASVIVWAYKRLEDNGWPSDWTYSDVYVYLLSRHGQAAVDAATADYTEERYMANDY